MGRQNGTRITGIGILLLVLLLGIGGCAKRGGVTPGPDEVEYVEPDNLGGQPAGPGEGAPGGAGVGEETLGAAGAEDPQKELQDVHFDFDRYTIRPEGRMILKENQRVLRRLPDVEVLIEGHCDERGTVEYNLALGQKRAEAVRDYMISLGMRSDQISTISYGEELPLDPRSNEEAWAKNRRAHTVILKR